MRLVVDTLHSFAASRRNLPAAMQDTVNESAIIDDVGALSSGKAAPRYANRVFSLEEGGEIAPEDDEGELADSYRLYSTLPQMVINVSHKSDSEQRSRTWSLPAGTRAPANRPTAVQSDTPAESNGLPPSGVDHSEETGNAINGSPATQGHSARPSIASRVSLCSSDTPHVTGPPFGQESSPSFQSNSRSNSVPTSPSPDRPPSVRLNPSQDRRPMATAGDTTQGLASMSDEFDSSSTGAMDNHLSYIATKWQEAWCRAENTAVEDDVPLGVMARTYRVLDAYVLLPKYHIRPLKWERRGEFPEGTSRCCYMPCVYRGHIYAALETSDNSFFVASLWKVPINDLSAAAWTQEDLPKTEEGSRWYWRSYFFTYNDSLYFIGKRKGHVIFSVWRLERPGRWTEIAFFPQFSEGWQDFGITVHNSYLVVCGGSRSLLRACLAVIRLPLDKENPEWDQRWPGLTADFYSPSVVVYRGKVQVTGSDAQRDVYAYVDSEDRTRRRWVPGEVTPTPFFRCAVETVNNCLLACGGYVKPFMLGYGARANVFMYCDDDQTNPRWLQLPSLNVARRRPYLLSAKHSLICLSGFNGTLVRTIEVLSMP